MNDVGSRCGFASFILPRYPKKGGPLDERPSFYDVLSESLPMEPL